ncbi:MAG: thioredoxin family protein [Deltaproteobacteria bacterium]|nr:thioredoxin family protein [Deltaproteobacteria bacterium]
MTSDDVKQIRVGKNRMGIIGLKQILSEVSQAHAGRPDNEIEIELLNRLSKKNYIPEHARAAYGQAFLKEFKKSIGQPVEESDANDLDVKVLGPGCSRCNQLEQDIMAVMNELGLAGSIEHVTDIIAIGEYGVMGTPALMLNGKVMAVGTVPPKAKLKIWLKKIYEK